MIGNLRMEFLKTTRRPGFWVLSTITVLVLVLLTYVLDYVSLHLSPTSPGFTDAMRTAILRLLYPDRFLYAVLSDFTSLGGAIALILGVLTLGSEYGWSTMKTMFTQGPGRLSLIAAKLLLLGIVLAVYTIVLLGLGAISSSIAAALDHVSYPWPPAGEILRAVGAGWLILATWTAIGVFLAAAFRGNALAIGLGLVYMLVIESILSGVFGRSGGFLHGVLVPLPGTNAAALAGSFGKLVVPGQSDSPAVAGALQAALVLAGYVAAAIVLTLGLIRRRDVS